MSDFGQWRALLHHAPDRARWEQLIHLSEERHQREPARFIEQWLPYASWHLERWPDALRQLPTQWHHKLTIKERYSPLELVRAASINRRKLTEALLQRPELAALTQLDVSGAQLEEATLGLALATNKRLKLTQLNLRQNGVDGEILGKLFDASTSWPQLRRLELGQNPLGERGAQALAQAKLPQLRQLGLNMSALGIRGMDRLSHSDRLSQLTHLDLSDLELSMPQTLAICARRPWPALTQLNFKRSRFSALGVTALLESLADGQLESLNLSFCALDQDSVAQLAASAKLRGLTSLDLSGNAISDEGLLSLLNSPHFTKLRVLKLHYNAITDASVEALLGWERFEQLSCLELWFNEISSQQRLRLSQRQRALGDRQQPDLWL